MLFIKKKKKKAHFALVIAWHTKTRINSHSTNFKLVRLNSEKNVLMIMRWMEKLIAIKTIQDEGKQKF
jgi:hypothetical protein